MVAGPMLGPCVQCLLGATSRVGPRGGRPTGPRPTATCPPWGPVRLGLCSQGPGRGRRPWDSSLCLSRSKQGSFWGRQVRRKAPASRPGSPAGAPPCSAEVGCLALQVALKRGAPGRPSHSHPGAAWGDSLREQGPSWEVLQRGCLPRRRGGSLCSPSARGVSGQATGLPGIRFPQL